MNQNSINSNYELNKKIALFTSKWKLILICVFLALMTSFIYLRYVTFEYQSSATIKINDNKKTQQVPEISSLQNYGLFSSDFSNIKDEIEIITSKNIINQVVEDLDLNIEYFVLGRIKEMEIYSNPPINISFLASDSIINTIDTTFVLKIKSDTKFTLANKQDNELLGTNNNDSIFYEFGQKIITGFSDIIFTPNIDRKPLKIGTSIKIRLRPVDIVSERLKSKINVVNSAGSNIINISVIDNLRDKASFIVNKIVEKYNEDVIRDKQLVVQATSDFINNRLDLVSNELESVDFTAENLQKNNRLTALTSQADIYLQSEKENEAKLITLSNQIQMVDYMKDHINDQRNNDKSLPINIGIVDRNVSEITNNHNALVQERDRLLRNSTIKNPTVINLNNQIVALKQTLNNSLENIQSTNQITLNTLKREDARIGSQIYSAPKKARQFRDIKRQQDIKESLYLYLLQKREESAIQLGLSSPNAKVIDKAYASFSPVTPKPLFLHLAALIIGLFVPISFIYITDLLDNKVHTKEDVQRLIKAPFIGDIPQSKGKLKVVSKVDYSPKAEAFRIIRTNINFMLQNIDSSCKTIFVTSTSAQEGKSHTSINLASSFSFSEKKVLLIETDIRIPRVNDYLKISSGKGLTDFISNKNLSIEDVTVKIPDNEFLDVIQSGAIPPNPAELLMSDRVNYLFDNAKTKYDYILVDTAAVGLVTDTLIISELADLFIYVVSANNIDKSQLYVAQTMYEEKRLPNMVTLLNGSVKKKGYGYGYGNNPKAKKKWYKPFTT